MVPVLVTVNVTAPAVTVAADSSTFHSDSLAVTVEGSSDERVAGAAATATTAPSAPATFRNATMWVCLMCDLLLRT